MTITKEELSKKILSTDEAARFLNIERNEVLKLLEIGKLTPIKKFENNFLFYKQDLKKIRLEEFDYLNCRVGAIRELDPYFSEVLIYFTIHKLCQYSFKKTDKVVSLLSKTDSLKTSIENIAPKIANFLNIVIQDVHNTYEKVKRSFAELQADDYVVKCDRFIYPNLLRMTEDYPRYLFMRGNVNLLSETIVSVVGSRKSSDEGLKKAYLLSKKLGERGIVVASGLAKGIDTYAHLSAIREGHLTIAVMGTPLSDVYPKENNQLLNDIEDNGLVITQFPPSAPTRRWNFPMRNAVMSGISIATIIVEAGQTSGSLIQAKHALKQNRLVFIPQSAFDNEKIDWPEKLILDKNSKKFTYFEDLINEINNFTIVDKSYKQLNLSTIEGGEINVY